MMYEFMKLDDNTEIVHSDILNYNQGEHVKVYFEKPIWWLLLCILLST